MWVVRIINYINQGNGITSKKQQINSLLSSLNFGHVYLPAATKLGQGNVFTGVCDSVHRGGVCGGRPPKKETPLKNQTPPRKNQTPRNKSDPPEIFRHPPEKIRHHLPPRKNQTPPRDTVNESGRYASYWNAFLSCDNFRSTTICAKLVVSHYILTFCYHIS